MRQDGSSQPAAGALPLAKPPQYISVTLPEGVTEGQTIHVQAPDGAVNAIVVPPGFGPGSTFTVEFAPPEEEAPGKSASGANNGYSATPSAPPPPPPPAGDDGFASGFNNPNYRPPPTANATTNFSGSNYAQSGTPAKPVYY